MEIFMFFFLSFMENYKKNNVSVTVSDAIRAFNGHKLDYLVLKFSHFLLSHLSLPLSTALFRPLSSLPCQSQWIRSLLVSNRHRPSHSLSERTESKVVLHTNEPERWVRDRGAINKNNRERQPPGNPSLYCLGRMHEKKFKKKRKDKITKKKQNKKYAIPYIDENYIGTATLECLLSSRAFTRKIVRLRK